MSLTRPRPPLKLDLNHREEALLKHCLVFLHANLADEAPFILDEEDSPPTEKELVHLAHHLGLEDCF